MISITSLSKNHGKLKALDAVSFQIKAGETIGIVGANGAGKSTLFQCIAGLENHTGKIEYEHGKLKDVLGFLPTNPHFLSKLTGKEYLQLMCNARKLSVTNIEEKNIFELPLDKYASTYSTGMKKKLALTGILLQKNEVYILDEPFSGVDLQSNILLKEIILKLKELNKTVMLSSHIFSILTDLCDTIHHIENGKLMRTAEKTDFKLIENDISNMGIKSKIDIFQLD